MPNQIIIGIHGLLNKPEKGTLEEWWLKSINDGLRLNHDIPAISAFELSYWADVRNSTFIPLEKLEERYELPKPPLARYKRKFRDSLRQEILEKRGGRLFDKEKDLIGLGTHIKKLIGIAFDDLDDYYKNEQIRKSIRDRLHQLLSKHKNTEIMLLAHSMGSIVAYDVLREWENRGDLNIKHFVTMGSPIGLPIVSHSIKEEFGRKRTPKSAHRWTNIADPRDKVSIDSTLADEYDDFNGVKVVDLLVNNEYVNHQQKSNNHKSYGYLRAPEVSDLVKEFLEAG